MSEKEETGNLTLPKATIAKLIRETLPEDIRCANDTRDLIGECCIEFIHLIASEANEICTKENKKTITPDHITKALEFIAEVTETHKKHITEVKEKPKVKKSLDNIKHMTQEQLLKSQMELFERARNKLSRSQDAVVATTSGSTSAPATAAAVFSVPLSPSVLRQGTVTTATAAATAATPTPTPAPPAPTPSASFALPSSVSSLMSSSATSLSSSANLPQPPPPTPNNSAM